MTRASFSRLDRRRAEIVARVRAAGGVMRSRALAREGFSAYDVRSTIERGMLCRVRKGWVAANDVDPLVREAVRTGVVLTCVTQARRLGLWVLGDTTAHVAAAPHSGGVKVTNSVVHWGAPPVPRDPDSAVDHVENVLWAVAVCRPEEIAIAIWESAVRRGLTSVEAMRRLPLPPAARRVCAQTTPWSDSGLESFIPPRLRWLGVAIIPQVWIAGHRIDFLIGDRIALQIDGGTHVGAQREQDIAHDAALMLLGYHVIRVGYTQIVERWHEVQDIIMRAVAQGLHLAR